MKLFKKYQPKSLEQQQQTVAQSATIGMRICQLISIATLCGLITAWILSQFNVTAAHQYYYNYLIIGILAGSILALMLEAQIEQSFELVVLYIHEHGLKAAIRKAGFVTALFVAIGFLTISVGGSYAGREDLASAANRPTLQDHTTKTNNILKTVSVDQSADLKAEKEATIAAINNRYDATIQRTLAAANRAKAEGRTKDFEWLSVGKVAQLNRQRERAIDRATKPINNNIQKVLVSASSNQSKALDMIADIQIQTNKENDRRRREAERNKARHKGMMSKAIWISAPLTLLLIILRVTMLYKQGTTTSNDVRASTPIPRSKDDFRNNSDVSTTPQQQQTTGNKKTPSENVTSPTGLEWSEYKELTKLARNNYRLGIKRQSQTSVDTAEHYIKELAKAGYLTIKGKRRKSQSSDVAIADAGGLLIDRFENPTLK